MMTRAARTHQAGHMRPAGRVFETPGVGDATLVRLGLFVILNNKQSSTGGRALDICGLFICDFAFIRLRNGHFLERIL